MAKEESGRLFSKVAKFVRNPLKDWSELDAQDADPAAQEAGYSREALKQMIERRQRNDFVRRREFDMLRKLRQREAAGGSDPSATPSSFNVSSTHGKSEGRALTLKKIDEIEEQMSQQWWKGRAPSSEGPATAAAQQARAYAHTTPDVPRDFAAATPESAPSVGGLDPAFLVYDSPLQEAAIRFAQGDDRSAEAILLQALAPDGTRADDDATWLGLLDFYRAIGDAEKFGATNTRYAQRTKRQGPEWVSLRALARDKQASAAAKEVAQSGALPAVAADWIAPSRLSRESLADLTRALGAASGPVWALDWRALKAIEPDAAAPLKALLAHWANSAVQLRFLSDMQLRAVLEAATPSNERDVEIIWWQLRMEALRVMHQPDDFELAALHYCITYETSPPPWEDPRGTYAVVEASATGGQAQAPAFSLTGARAEALQPDASDPPSLLGDLVGEVSAVWRRLDAELADAEVSTVSCAALLRLDLVAGSSLLDWVAERDGRGQRVTLIDAHRLIVAFCGVIGITRHAVVQTRVG